ncbi:hypothetical protein K2173_027255 [Erythroxylum novogranatense]|uniref:Uncharacterized protein n=1 Tax=Erythroxylum novogranatense TaxID=1862640 RepID=A0AAV8TYU9_9ROSI|nr:hypothetical protein K2173_027255 [Erythroxylum novogranatense]
MEKFKRSKELVIMGRVKPDGRCKKHPKHQQTPGVCSLCLNEKLSNLLTASSRGRGTRKDYSSSSSSSLSSYYSSCSNSSYSTPIPQYRYFPNGKGSSFSYLFGGKNALTKSRSLAFTSRMRRDKVCDDDNQKKGGFFSRLLRPRHKRTDEGLVHSRSTRERVIIVTN